MTTSRIGLFIIRAWVEPGSSLPLRAHIRRTTDVSQGLEQGLTVAEKEAVVAAVRAWLSEMVAGALTGEDDSDNLSNM
jgi:predicted transcriptional regulator